MDLNIIKRIKWLNTLSGLWLVLFSLSVYAVPQEPLSQAYQAIQQQERIFDEPLWVQSDEKNGYSSAEVFSQLPFSFDHVSSVLSDVSAWCRFMPLNLNVKACLYRQDALTLYLGRKYYQSPEESDKLSYVFELIEHSPSRLAVMLTAAEGPMGTSDYRIYVEAVPKDEATVIHIQLSYTSGLLARLATATYLTTLGRDKVGFSIEGHNEQGEPIFVQGLKGIIERNVMRYYLAVKADLQTIQLPEEKRFEARLRRWFQLTEKYARQLWEISEEEYLDMKRREWPNQQTLQKDIKAAAKR